VCRPIRTFSTPVPAGHGAAIRTRCASTAAPTARTAEENATAIPSPVVENSTPLWRANAARSVWSCRTRDLAMAADSVSHSRVEPSMSVKRKVTVPAGSSLSLVPVGDGLATAVLIVASAGLALSRWSDVRMAAGGVWGGS
jgi:hypothetical protein